MAWKSKESPLPPASLHLLVPPVRLMSAFIWQAVQQHNVMKYDKLGDFITLVTEMVPDILSNRKRAGLIISLRARLILELCRSDGVAHQQTIRNHLDKIHSCCAALNSTDQMVSRDVLKTSYANFAHLVQNLLNIPFEKELFFNEVFPKIYGPDFNQRLQQLVFEFLSRLEELLPIPDLQQTAAWFAETSSVSEAFEQHLSEPFGLKTLLLHHKQLVAVRSAPPSREEDVRWSGLVLPAPAGNQTEILEWEYLSEDSQSSDVAADDSVPRGESGSLSGLFVCPQCSFTHRRKRKVQEHIQSEHHLIAPIQEETSVRTQTARSAPMREDAKKKKKKKSKHKGYAEKEQQHKNMKQIVRRTEVLGDDRRFLTTRPVTKNFTEEETKCPKCEKVFEHPNQLRTHLKLHSLPYRCSQCEKGFSSVSGYHQHQRLHKRGRVFTCGQCNKGFLCSYSLKQHERLHEGPTCVCTVCGRGFSKAGIVRHMQMHRGERNYLCTTCGKSFLSSGELMLHTRSHTGDTPYTCSHCGKGFSSKSHLSVHTRSHTGERPYLCAECPKRFLTLNCLKRHALSHNGVKPFKCPCCEREFSQQGNMKRHLATHKPDPSSVCLP